MTQKPFNPENLITRKLGSRGIIITRTPVTRRCAGENSRTRILHLKPLSLTKINKLINQNSHSHTNQNNNIWALTRAQTPRVYRKVQSKLSKIKGEDNLDRITTKDNSAKKKKKRCNSHAPAIQASAKKMQAGNSTRARDSRGTTDYINRVPYG